MLSSNIIMATAITTKENDGKSRYQRQRRIVRIIVISLTIFIGYQLLVSHFLMGIVPDIEIDKETGRKRIRKRPERNQKIDSDGKVTYRTPIDGIIEGQLHLIDIIIPDNHNNNNNGNNNDGNALSTSIFTDTDYNIKGIFCVLEWSIQSENPSNVPLYEDLIRESTMCSVTRHTADLYEMVTSARKYDLHFRNISLTKRTEKRQRQKHIPSPIAEPIERSVPPTALIFHESRCGSTLVSNILATITTTSDNGGGSSRVYSEPNVLLKAIEACPIEDDNVNDNNNEGGDDNTNNNNNNNNCNSLMHQQLIRDIFYMMGRTQIKGPEHNNYLFYKLQSKAIHYLSLIESSFDPEPMPQWIYLYRDNIHVMQSHFQGSVLDPSSEEHNVLGQKKPPKCLEGYKGEVRKSHYQQQQQQPEEDQSQELEVSKQQEQQQLQSPSKVLQDLVHAQGRTVESLSQEEYCAANLASLSESAIKYYNYQKQQVLRDDQVPPFFINYKQLPDIMWDHVLPALGVELQAKDIHRMEKVAAVYTQSRTGGKNKNRKKDSGGVKVFTGDNKQKEEDVAFSIAQAAHDFMDQTFVKLETISRETLQARNGEGRRLLGIGTDTSSSPAGDDNREQEVEAWTPPPYGSEQSYWNGWSSTESISRPAGEPIPSKSYTSR